MKKIAFFIVILTCFSSLFGCWVKDVPAKTEDENADVIPSESNKPSSEVPSDNTPIDNSQSLPAATPSEPIVPPEIVPHSHSWDNGIVTQDASCKSAGVLKYTCSCGETKTESIPKLTTHKYDKGTVVGTTKTYTCTVCGKKKTETVEPYVSDPFPNSTPKKKHAYTIYFVNETGPISVVVKVNDYVEYTGTHYYTEGSLTLNLIAPVGQNTVTVLQNNSIVIKQNILFE